MQYSENELVQLTRPYSIEKITDIVKHSKNVIDLIEVGDYVNKRKIERVNDYGEYKRADFNLDFDDYDAVYNESIKTIVTKQQFESIKYKI